jgi:hypothetical protein
MPRKYALSIIITILVALASCIQNVTEEPSIVAADTLTPTEYSTITPTIENVFPQPPIPTLSINDEMKMVELLKASKCNLPCYMGIVPGKTKLSDVRLLLNSFGASLRYEGVDGNRIGIEYLMVFDDPAIYGTNEKHIAHTLHLLVIDDVVQRISIWILARGLSPKFQDYWSRYSPKGVFLQTGVPEMIYVGSGTLALVYEQLGVINMYETFWKDGQLCPQNETVYFDRRFEITNPDSPIEIYSEHANALKSREIWKPVEDALGVSVQEFYNQVIADDSVCFDIKVTSP